jgi:hypothetical protein
MLKANLAAIKVLSGDFWEVPISAIRSLDAE